MHKHRVFMHCVVRFLSGRQQQLCFKGLPVAEASFRGGSRWILTQARQVQEKVIARSDISPVICAAAASVVFVTGVLAARKGSSSMQVTDLSDSLAHYLELALGGKPGDFKESQRLIEILATPSDECFRGAEADAIIVCGDPSDLTAPVRAAEAVAKSKARILVISGGAGMGGTAPLLHAATAKFNDLCFTYHSESQLLRSPVPAGLSQAGKPMNAETAMKYITEADIYLAIVMKKLIECYNFSSEEIEVRYNEKCVCPKGERVKLKIFVENRSTHSGENAQFCEELLRDYLWQRDNPKVIFVKAPLLLLRGVLTMRKEKGDIAPSAWLGGNAHVLAYAEPCPNLEKSSRLERLEALAQAAGELVRIVNYNGKHLDAGPDFPFDRVAIVANVEKELHRVLKLYGGRQSCGTN